jgi:hypothetical protein
MERKNWNQWMKSLEKRFKKVLKDNCFEIFSPWYICCTRIKHVFQSCSNDLQRFKHQIEALSSTSQTKFLMNTMIC